MLGVIDAAVVCCCGNFVLLWRFRARLSGNSAHHRATHSEPFTCMLHIDSLLHLNIHGSQEDIDGEMLLELDEDTMEEDLGVRRLCPLIIPIFSPHFRVYEVVSLHRCVLHKHNVQYLKRCSN